MPEEKSKETVKQLFIQFLESRNLRKTPERFAILEKIYTTTQHFDVETLYEAMIQNGYRSGFPTLKSVTGIFNIFLHISQTPPSTSPAYKIPVKIFPVTADIPPATSIFPINSARSCENANKQSARILTPTAFVPLNFV